MSPSIKNMYVDAGKRINFAIEYAGVRWNGFCEEMNVATSSRFFRNALLVASGFAFIPLIASATLSFTEKAKQNIVDIRRHTEDLLLANSLHPKIEESDSSLNFIRDGRTEIEDLFIDFDDPDYEDFNDGVEIQNDEPNCVFFDMGEPECDDFPSAEEDWNKADDFEDDSIYSIPYQYPFQDLAKICSIPISYSILFEGDEISRMEEYSLN